jgi:ATP-dependent RNA helicase DDX24/MAK5
MAAEPPPHSSQPSKRKHWRKRTVQDTELERFDSLPWSSSLPDDDPFSMVVGTNELEGGLASFIDLIICSVGFREIEKKRKEKKKFFEFMFSVFEVSLYLE